MKINIQTLLLIGILALLAYVVFFMPDNTDTLLEYWENKDFKTDTVIYEVDYTKLPKPEYKNYVPPAVVINYIDSTKVIENTRYVQADDSLIQVIDSLTDEITKISLAYLKLYPSAPKFIYGEFTGDSLRFDLLAIGGQISSHRYGVNYQRYSYQWSSEDGLKAGDAYKPSFSDILKKSALYGNAGYSLSIGKPYISLDYNIYLKKLRFQADGFLSVEQEPQFIFNLGAGYKIF
jgi:hypothetical protein